jgi:hypothetical protein
MVTAATKTGHRFLSRRDEMRLEGERCVWTTAVILSMIALLPTLLPLSSVDW